MTRDDRPSARDELRALLQRYARAADDRDVTALQSLFHPSARIDGASGSQDVTEWLATMRAPRIFPHSMHVLGDPLVELDDDGQRAELDTYGVVYQLGDAASGQGDLTLGIRYLDRAERHHGRWVLTHRRAQTCWMR